MKNKIGDRYRWYKYGNASFADTIEFIGDERKWLIVEGRDAGQTYDAGIENSDSWIYIGNFAKSENFSNLYQLLNGD